MKAASQGTRLRDGAMILIRPIEAGDKGAIVSGFENLSPESRYRRFFSPLDNLTDRDLDYFTEVDHRDHEALIAQSANGETLGVARYVRGADPERAEVAVVVVDEWHGRGVGTALLTRLADRAREEGVKVFTATILAENRGVLDLMRSIGDTHRVGPTSTTMELEIELPRRGIGARLRGFLRDAAAGIVTGRDPAHPQTRLR
jgi:GNAT superfamily N-acetyltransferase